MSDEVLTCREGGHYFPWGRAVRERLREEGRDLVQTTRACACCRSRRVDVYDANTLTLVRRGYNLVDGYASDPGQGRISRQAVRAELLRRFTTA